jgi:branched-chain amino acid transport system ATP-binding protein
MFGLAGELTPLDGLIEMFGESGRRPLYLRARQGLGLVPEERSVTMGLSVRDNLRLGPGGVEGALEYGPELEPILHRKARMLSGGELQILTLSRVLAAKPKLLLADELSLGLAPLVVQRLLKALRQAADQGTAVLIVEQHVRSALAVADQMYVMRRGQVVLQGRASDFHHRIDDIEAAYIAGDPTLPPELVSTPPAVETPDQVRMSYPGA